MSLDMAANDDFDHVDSRGRDFGPRIRAFGYRGSDDGREPRGRRWRGAAATFEQVQALARAPRATCCAPSSRSSGSAAPTRADSMLGWYWTTTFGATRDRAVAC